MKLKITTDGTQMGTKILDAKTGEEVDNVRNFVIKASPEGIEAEVVLLLRDGDLHFTGEFEVLRKEPASDFPKASEG